MTAIESLDIILYAPKSNMLPSVFMGMFLPIGLALPFFAGGQWLTLLLSFLFIISPGFWAGLVEIWKMFHHPVLVINTEGFYSPVSHKKHAFNGKRWLPFIPLRRETRSFSLWMLHLQG